MVKSIDDKTHAEIAKKTDLGNTYMDREQWHDAIAAFESALDLLPEPKNNAYFSMRNFSTAEHYFSEAAQWLDGQQNAFVMLRLGEVSFELGKFAVGDDSLMRAFLLMGISIFDGEDPKYLRYMQEEFKVS